MSARLSTSKK